MRRKIVSFTALVLGLTISTCAIARIYIPIDQPIDKKFPIAIADLSKTGSGSVGGADGKISEIIRYDLSLTGYFDVIPERAYIDRSDDITADTIDFARWTKIGARAIVKGTVEKEGEKVVVKIKLFDPVDREMLVGKQYAFEPKDMRNIAHRFSDEIMLSLSGIRGVFGTKIAYIVQTGKSRKSVYLMDMDGANVRAITKDKSLSLGPTFSPDGQKLSYASYVGGYPDIYIADLASGQINQITSNKATNITPYWSPTGAWVAYASSISGNMEIYIMLPTGENNRKVTNSFGIDVAPSFSPEGNEIVYASERGGNLHIYRQSLLGGNPERVTFVGGHNDSPDWSPDGQKIAFCGRSGEGFDVYTVDIGGSNAQRLTVGSGSNEHPRWSPDGRFIVFSSTRTGKPLVYMMRYDGANQIPLMKKKTGMMPDWGPWEDSLE